MVGWRPIQLKITFIKINIMKSKKIIPATLTSLAFLMAWFIVFFIVLFWYLKSFGPLIAKTGFVSDLGFVITFYIIIAFFMIIFGTWFSSKFFKVGSKKKNKMPVSNLN